MTYANERLSRIANGFGAYFDLVWQNGRITGVSDSAGRSVAYSYDGSGRMVQFTDWHGKVWRFGYDDETHAMVAETDPLSHLVVTNAYNALCQVTNQLNASGGVTTFGYAADAAAWSDNPLGGRTEETFRLVRAVVRAADKPLVLDADAIFAVSRDLSLLDRAKAPIYLTPHDGEFRSLFGERAGRDRPAETTAFAKAHRCTVIRKGAETICARPDGRTVVLHADNPGMAKGGSGDVLAGVLGAFLCQLPEQWAAETAVWAHSLAGAICARRLGEYGMNPTDLIDALAEATKSMTAED